jgi:L-arabinokinase
VEVVGIDTGIRHDVGGAAYRMVRTGAAIGYRMIADLLHLGIKPVGSDHVNIHDPVLGGYLANLGPSQFERKFAHRLPERTSGKNFMDCFGGIVDREITVDPRQEYAVRAATAFPVYENLRAITFAGLLSQGGGVESRDALWAMGELMLATHDGYNRAGLGDASADELVELALAEGPEQGIYGAKTSGGGSGGTVVLLLDRRGRPALERIAAQYGKRTGKQPHIVRGTSGGAQTFGVRAVLLQD